VSSEPERTPAYRKDADTESLLTAVNRRLAQLEVELVARFELPRFPTLFVVGAPRSGTTLLEQLLLARFELGYVTNLAARFWMAPYVGSNLSVEVAYGLDTRGPAFESTFGATAGPGGPHEFGYFWRRWFAYGETHDAGDTAVRSVDGATLGQELAAIESVFDRPLVLKNPVCSFHVGFLAQVIPGAIFVHCRREPLYAAQSLAESRVRYHGDRAAWFSIKPAEYKRLRDLPWPEQVVGQVYFTRAAIDRQFRTLAATRRLELDYETLCDAPEAELDRIAAWVAENGHVLRRRASRLPTLAKTNRRTIESQDFDALRRACDAQFSTGGGGGGQT
jgi:Sulfotransferase family